MEMNQRKWLMLSSLALLVSISSCASFTAAEAEPIQQVIPLSNLTAAQIFTKSQLWASNTFVSAKDAIELVDKDAGIITIRTRYDAHAYSTGEALGGKYYCTYKILLEIKEGKTRMTCQNPTVEAVVNGRTTQMSSLTEAFVTEFNDHAINIINNYIKYMNTKSESW